MESGRRNRIRLEQPGDDDRKGRTGCIAMGAVLGVLAGVMVALYALPPILNSLYGEKAVAPGASRTVDGIEFRVISFTVGPDEHCEGLPACPPASIQLSMAVTAAADEGWTPDPEDFLVEVDGVETWIEAIAPLEGVPATDLRWLPSQQRTVVVRFPLPLGSTAEAAEPVAIHVTTPRARLELDGSLRQ